MQPNIVWNQVASRRGFLKIGHSMFSESMETKQPMMSSSLPAMVVTAASKVSSIFLLVVTSPFSGGDFPGVVVTSPFSGGDFPGVVVTSPFSGGDFPGTSFSLA
jgi:hypothetical protein